MIPEGSGQCEGEGGKEERRKVGCFCSFGWSVGWLVHEKGRERGTEERKKYNTVNVACKVPVS